MNNFVVESTLKKRKNLSDIEENKSTYGHSKKKKTQKIKVDEEAIEIDDEEGEHELHEEGSAKIPAGGKSHKMNNFSVESPLKKRKNLNYVDNKSTYEHSKKKKAQNIIVEEEVIEVDDEGEHVLHEEAIPKIMVGENAENVSWTKEDYFELIRRMEIQLPKVDTMSFTSRVEKLDWDQIRFKDHTVDDCYDKWKIIRGKVRHFRLLGEMLQDAKAWVEKPWSAPLSKKKARHPEQPPRPLSSFMLFYMDKKNKIIKRHPELRLTEISRMIGEKYKALSEEKKSYYVEKAKSMQEEYKQNLSKFYEKYPELMRVTKKQTNKNNKPLPPIKLYLNDKLQKHQKDENFNQHDFLEKYKEMWKHLSTKKKAYWIRQAKDAEEKYLEQLHEDMLHDGENKPSTSYKSVISKDENAILDRLAGKPEKPPNSAYSLFSRLMLQDKDHNYVEGEPKNRMREIANKWREVPDEQKKAYAEKVQHMHEAYKLEFATYLESLPEDKKAEELAKLQPKKKPGRKQKAVKKGAASSDPGKENLFKNEPEKPPVTAWDLYKNEFFKKYSHLPSKVAYKQAADMWKTLPKKETDKYKKKLEQIRAKYMVDFEAFLESLTEEELKEYSVMKNARSGENDLQEDSLGEESSTENEQMENSSGSLTNSSEDSDSGVSEDNF